MFNNQITITANVCKDKLERYVFEENVNVDELYNNFEPYEMDAMKQYYLNTELPINGEVTGVDLDCDWDIVYAFLLVMLAEYAIQGNVGSAAKLANYLAS